MYTGIYKDGPTPPSAVNRNTVGDLEVQDDALPNLAKTEEPSPTEAADNSIPQSMSRASDEKDSPSITGTAALKIHTEVYAAAHQLQVHGLLHYARKRHWAALDAKYKLPLFVDSITFGLENSKILKGNAEYFLLKDL